MSPSSNALPPPVLVPPARAEVRPLYWSVRRELWENRSLTLAPMAVGGFVLFGALVSTFLLPHRLKTLSSLAPEKQAAGLAMPYSVLASLILLTAYVVGAIYCLDALHGERRDRSILFWKSLPVSDLTTVLSKAVVPLAFLPAFAFTLALAGQLLLFQVSVIVLRAAGPGPAVLFSKLPFIQMTLVMAYGVIVHALWHAPIYAWFLLLSAWARRVPFLWAILPPLALCALEAMTFRTSYFARFLGYRLVGAMKLAFDVGDRHDILTLAQLSPERFLSSPGLWIGLLLAAGFLAAAVRLRRDREPI